VFRLSRIRGEVEPDGEAGSYDVPPGTDVRALTQTLAPPPADRTATVLVRSGAAHGLRRHAEPHPGTPADGEAPDGWERLSVRYGADEAFADEVLGYGADVVVLEPEEVRASVVRRLQEAAG
jgi:proteasome accessory factor B